MTLLDTLPTALRRAIDAGAIDHSEAGALHQRYDLLLARLTWPQCSHGRRCAALLNGVGVCSDCISEAGAFGYRNQLAAAQEAAQGRRKRLAERKVGQ